MVWQMPSSQQVQRELAKISRMFLFHLGSNVLCMTLIGSMGPRVCLRINACGTLQL